MCVRHADAQISEPSFGAINGLPSAEFEFGVWDCNGGRDLALLAVCADGFDLAEEDGQTGDFEFWGCWNYAVDAHGNGLVHAKY